MSTTAGTPVAATAVRSLASTAERLAAVRLYREAFGLPATDPAITPKLLSALQRHGGSAIGAFDDDGTLVGFTYGFVGLDHGTPYHHSQAAAVAPRVQGRGVGRLLKRAQAEVAAATGVRTMRWTYDPLQARNAHFNLDVLGAVGRWFSRDYYGMDDNAGRTDRVVVEWPLDGTAVPPVPSPVPIAVPDWGRTHEEQGVAWLAVPARWDEVRPAEPARAALLRDEVAGALERLMGAGLVLVSCRLVDGVTALYRLGEAR